MRKRKRTHIFVQPPEVYEIAGCPVDEFHKITWSEFEHHLWCFECEQDFIPKHWGIFDGPIPIGLCGMMGISFDRMNIKTHRITPMPAFDGSKLHKLYDKTWNTGKFDRTVRDRFETCRT